MLALEADTSSNSSYICPSLPVKPKPWKWLVEQGWMFSTISSFPREPKVFQETSFDGEFQIANENLIFAIASSVLQRNSRSPLTLRKGIFLFLLLQGRLYVIVPVSVLAPALLKLVKLLWTFLVVPKPRELPAPGWRWQAPSVSPNAASSLWPDLCRETPLPHSRERTDIGQERSQSCRSQTCCCTSPHRFHGRSCPTRMSKLHPTLGWTGLYVVLWSWWHTPQNKAVILPDISGVTWELSPIGNLGVFGFLFAASYDS